MKTILHFTTTALLLCGSHAWSQTGTYTNFIRQVQYPGPVERDTSCDTAGQRPSELAIDPGGARFELHTVTTIGGSPVGTLLDSCYVGASIPISTTMIRTEDPTGAVPRTRADRPFWVDLSVSEILNGPTDSPASKRVTLLRHVQPYGSGGNGSNINRAAASLQDQRTIENTIPAETLAYTLTSIPGANRSKVRGEERFSVFTVEDRQVSPGGIVYKVDATQIAAQTVQIWPVADGSITGISANQVIRFSLPTLTLALNDLYPSSTTYAQVYKGDAQLGMIGTVVPGSGIVVPEPAPKNEVLSLTNYDSVFDSDGRWTMELLTVTPFGIDRLAYVTFELDRTIEMNASFTTIE